MTANNHGSGYHVSYSKSIPSRSAASKIVGTIDDGTSPLVTPSGFVHRQTLDGSLPISRANAVTPPKQSATRRAWCDLNGGSATMSSAMAEKPQYEFGHDDQDGKPQAENEKSNAMVTGVMGVDHYFQPRSMVSLMPVYDDNRIGQKELVSALLWSMQNG